MRKRHKERKPVPSCLPGCDSLGPLTGASTLFSNTAHRQPDKTKTLIYTSLHLTISFCFSVLCYPPIPYLCRFLFCFAICACVHLSDYVLLPVRLCFHFSLCIGVQADRNSRPGSNRLHQMPCNHAGGN